MSSVYTARRLPRCPPRHARCRGGFMAVVCGTALLHVPFATVPAQGVTTAAIRGVVHASDGHSIDDARVIVRNGATGFVVHTSVEHARFVVDGLEVGGPYSVTVTRLGFSPERRDGIVLALGESRALNILMQPVATQLDTVRASTSVERLTNGHEGMGLATTLTDPLLHALPTLNRNVYDFVELSPQVSTKIGFAAGGMSGGGSGFRFNEFLLNGVSLRSVGGQVPPEFAGAESVPFDAVREYRILLTPFDVRYGDFSGALVDMVTRSGTNHFEGSVFSFWRSDGLARRATDSVLAPYNRLQYGFSLGGPLVRDRLHFFVATDEQRFTSPAPGPYIGQPSSLQPVPVSESDVARLDQILRGYGLTAGSAGPVQNENPLSSLYARLDAALPEANSRVILWLNQTWSQSLSFSRVTSGPFPLSSFAVTQASDIRSAALQLHTDLSRAGGGHNELLVSRFRAANGARPHVRQPIVTVAVPSTSGGVVVLETGTPAAAQGTTLGGQSIQIRDDLTLPLGASHVVTIGMTAEPFRSNRSGVANTYGTWTFSSLDSLASGTAESFMVSRDFGSANASLGGAQFAAYVGDEWQLRQRFSLTAGIRADLLELRNHAPFNATIDSIFGRRTDEMPRHRPELSPRLGFAWEPFASGGDELRGGIGMFTARPPVAWLHAPVYSYGVGIGMLRCGNLPAPLGAPPPFAWDYRAPPLACANGASLTSIRRGNVDLLDHGLRMGRTLRAALSYDRRLPLDLTGSVEALVTRSLSDFAFVNLNLTGPQGVDRNGRVMYGAVDDSGIARPVLRSTFPEVIDLRNVSLNHAAQLSARLQKHWGEAITAMASYTFSRVRDTETPLRVNTPFPGTDNWASRAVSGREDDLRPGISLNDIPHRVVFAGTRRASWRGWPTELSVYYVGESGSPFTYTAYGTGGRGDLNADGSAANDPIYVPRNALDTTEIRFSTLVRQLGGRTDSATAQEQGEALERFIEAMPCLRRQRGRIMTRNSCREPWSNTTIASLRQGIPIGGRTAEVQVDVYNLLNVLHRAWGQYRVANPALLQQVGQTSGTPSTPQAIFQFPPSQGPWLAVPAQSAFQLQLALRYRF